MSDSVSLDANAVDDVLDDLEDAMEAAEVAHSHDDIRPSVVRMGQEIKTAYRTLVEEHPDYELNRGE